MVVDLRLAIGRRRRVNRWDIVRLYEDVVKCQSAGEDARVEPVFETSLGRLHKGDCLELLGTMDEGSVDLVFADPPFNLKRTTATGTTTE